MCERCRKKGGAFILGSWGVNSDVYGKFPTDFAEIWHTASWAHSKTFVLLTFCPNRRLCWPKLQISVPDGQKWEFFDFDGKYLKLCCSWRLAVGDIFCSALRWASADVSLVFLWEKLSEIWPIFWRQSRNHFFVSANFAYFFSFWPLQGVTPGRIQSRQIHLAGNPGSFFCLQIEKVLCLHWDRSFIPAPKFSFLPLPSIKLSSFFDKTLHRRSGVPEVACCCGKSSIFSVFLLIFDEIFCALHLSIFQEKNEVLKN